MELTRASALIEGIAVATRKWRVAAVRREQGIFVGTAPARFAAIRAVPFLRGLFVHFVEAPGELQWSATAPGPPPEQLPRNGWRSPFAIFMMLAWAHGLPQLALHFAAPSIATASWTFQVAVLAIQLAVFLLYLRLIQRVKGMSRVFQYAGAFKKALWQLRSPRPELRDQPGWHWHSSTIAVALSLAMVAVAAGELLPRLSLGGWTTLFVRVGLTFLAFSAANEIQIVLTKLGPSLPVRVLFAPLLLVDRIGTGTPDDEMLEVANACIAKLRALESE